MSELADCTHNKRFKSNIRILNDKVAPNTS